jgi:hypothetical protein
MPASRASYTIEPEVLSRFNAVVPQGERSKVIETYMKQALESRERDAAAIAEEFMTHPDFAGARAECAIVGESALKDGLDD